MPGEMDVEFSLGGVADLPALFARRQAAAQQATARFAPLRGLRYGPGPDHRLNVFAGSGDAPVLVFLHGGFWKSLDADLFAFLAPGFVPQGAILVVVDYPLMPVARMADVVEACRSAVLWVRDNIAQHGGDPRRIHVAGNSAGGHLVAELLDDPALKGVVASGVAISGIYCLEPVTRSFQNDNLCLTADEVARFSPARRTLSLHAPVLVAVGGNETAEFHRQSAAFAAQVGADCLVVPRTDHITILLDALADPATPLNRAVRDQMFAGG